MQINDWCLIELIVIGSKTFDNLTVYKQMGSGSYIYKEDLALNSLQWLMYP